MKKPIKIYIPHKLYEDMKMVAEQEDENLSKFISKAIRYRVNLIRFMYTDKRNEKEIIADADKKFDEEYSGTGERKVGEK